MTTILAQAAPSPGVTAPPPVFDPTEAAEVATEPLLEPKAGQPMGAEKRRLRAVEYRHLAAAAEALAGATSLPNVREKHERAFATWTALAKLNEAPSIAPAGARETSLLRASARQARVLKATL